MDFIDVVPLVFRNLEHEQIGPTNPTRL